MIMIRTIVVACLIAITACSAGAQPTAGAANGKFTDEKMQHDGRERRFLVHDFAKGGPAPVVIVLHGGGGHPENAANMSQMDLVAARENFIAVYPGGTGGMPGGKLLTWNATHCCAYARENKVDDVGFIRKMIDELVSSGRADPKRIFVTGMSNGGMMTHVLARELPDRIAAIAPVVGAIFGDEPPARAAMPAIIFVGQDDHNVPAAGGPLGGASKRGSLSRLRDRPEDHDVAPAIAAAEYWAKANGCAAPVKSSPEKGRFEEIRWENCNSGAPVAFYSVVNNGHAWPGGKAGRAEADQPTQAVNASEMMWDFFKVHPKQ